MMPIKDNQDVACFYVTKHSWRGKYKRIFSVGTLGITTYNPNSLEVTNRWPHSDIFSVCPILKDPTEFVIAMRRLKDSGGGNTGTGKTESMQFSSEHRAQILSQALRYRHLFATADQAALKAEARDHYNAYKLHWSETRLPVMLRVGAASLDQLDPTTKVLLASYPYYKMESLIEVSGEPAGSFVVVSGGFGRMHMFTSSQSKEIINKIIEAAPYYSGVQVRVQSTPITLEHFNENRLGKYSDDEHVTSICEFPVQKVSAGEGMVGCELLEGGKRHLEPQRRTLCLTATCLVERDPQTYAPVTLRPLSSICSIVRSPENPQLFALEYDCGQVRSYMATDRDSLLATLLDAVRATGNRDVHVRMALTPRGKRLGPLNVPVDEEVESMHLKFLQQPPGKRTFAEMVERFNANVPYSGLIHSVTQDGILADNKEKKITAALQALMKKAGNPPNSPGGSTNAPELSDPSSLMELEAQFHSLRRLTSSKVGFAAFTNLPGFREYIGCKVVRALRCGEEGVAQAALDTVCALMQPMHCQHIHLHQPQDIRQEQLNKSSLLSSRTFLASLLDMWTSHVSRGTGALVVAAMLDFLTFALCVPYSETTDGTHFDVLLKMVAERGRSLFRLFQHPSLAIVKGAGLVMRAVVEEGEAEVAARMQDLALAEGALPRHLLAALFTLPPSLGGVVSRSSTKNGPIVVDSRLLAHRQLSRHLVGLWVTGHPTAMGLLKRIMPAGLLAYLDSDEKVPPHEEEHLMERDNLKLAQADSEGRGASWSFRKPTAQQWASMERQLRLVEKQVERTLQHWSARVGFSPDWVAKSGLGNIKPGSAPTDLSSRPVVLRKRRERIKSEANWLLFYYQFGKDHALPNLIWNHKTRDELRDALDNEVKSFVADREVASSGGTMAVSWNHAEFEVTYQCLADEIRIGDYYLRLLLERDGVNTGLKAPVSGADQESDRASVTSSSSSPIKRSYEFFNDLYHRFLLSAKPEMKCMCLQAMAIVYGRHHEDIGPFSDTKYIVEMLFRCMDRTERDRLLIFLSNLALVRRNVKEFLDANGVRVLVDLLTLAHLHEGRATLPTAAILAGNTIEAAPKGQGESSVREEEKEWYYGGSSEEMKGPVTFKEMQKLWSENKLNPRTRCWAQGMDGWRPLVQVPQLRWTLIAANSNPPVMDETRLAMLILDTLIRMCNFFPSRDADKAVIRPIPRVKRQISDPGVLPHLSQLLLTFEPGLVERVCTLLWEALRDNPGSAIAMLHHTGAVYFALMYTGSNVLPVARLLHLTHSRLGASKNPNEDPGWPRGASMLGQLLPEAMVSYLENHGPEKFAEIFLGEFDTPEAIWNAEMRRMMIERIAAHVADFSPRLRSNIRAQYVYCAIPAVRYPQLERELFCGIYYLRHLCDTTRFPEWPIARPVELLREILEAWRAEVEKKPPSMSIADAYKVLGLNNTSAKGKDKGDNESKEGSEEGKVSVKQYDEAIIRKAYYRLAAKFHPDKNPDGRDQFEAVNKAYEFLCSRSAWSASDGPDPNNIVLVLKAQSILFERYTEELHPYKYAGYPQLIKTIRIETSDDRLFCKEAPLLAAATELAYHTLQCSAINAEELRRERGLDALLEAFSRCVSVIGDSTAPSETGVHVCHNAIRCFTVAARFQACREKMEEMTGLVPDLCRVLRFKHLFRLCSSAVECVSALSVDGILQMQLLQWGALARLLPTFFAYDYTLDEGGVTRSENANQQEVSNRLAKLAVGACARLGGYLQSDAPNSEDESQLPRETPVNPVARSALSALLTPYLARHLAKDQPQELLKILTSNTENPYLIWNNETRAELGEHLEEQGKRQWGSSEGGGDHALLADSSFKYTSHEKELMVGEVFLKIYNDQPTFPIENPKGFTIDLLEFIKQKTQIEIGTKTSNSLIELGSDAVAEAEDEVKRIQNVVMALRSLENVIKNNPGVDIQCIGHFTLLFSLLRPEERTPGLGWRQCRPEVQAGALGVLAIASRNQQCVEDIAANGPLVLPHLLMAIHSLPIGSQGSAAGGTVIFALDTLHALMSNPKIVKESLSRGAIIYLLAIFCDVARGTARSGGVTGRAGASISLREKAAELLGKMSADKLVGAKVRLVLGKLLPAALADSFRGDTGSTLSAASCVEAFEARHANPELVWDDDARRQLCSAIGNLAEEYYNSQRENLSTLWRLPEENTLVEMLGGSSTIGGGAEAVVGGVYLRLYVANPNWQLRRPREFLIELLDTCLSVMNRDPKTVDVEFLDLCTNSIVALLKSQPALADQVPALGHLPRLCQLMGKSATALVPKSAAALGSRKEDPVPKAAIQILHQVSTSQVCIEALSHTDCIAPLSAALRTPGLVIGDPTGGDVTAVACETLYRLFSANYDELVRQALHADLVPFLLSLLEGGTVVGGGAKAQVVKALKAMERSQLHGERVANLLARSPVWADYRDQRHDLFISGGHQPAYLTGAPPGVAGYLTQGTTKTLPDAPPPLDTRDDDNNSI